MIRFGKRWKLFSKFIKGRRNIVLFSFPVLSFREGKKKSLLEICLKYQKYLVILKEATCKLIIRNLLFSDFLNKYSHESSKCIGANQKDVRVCKVRTNIVLVCEIMTCCSSLWKYHKYCFGSWKCWKILLQFHILLTVLPVTFFLIT